MCDECYDDPMTERMLAATFVRDRYYDEDRPARKKKKSSKKKVNKPSTVRVSRLDNQNKVVITIDKAISITLDIKSAVNLANKIMAIEE